VHLINTKKLIGRLTDIFFCVTCHVTGKECLDAEQFFKLMSDMGVPIKLQEQIESEKRFA
jgi:hypothetical protein